MHNRPLAVISACWFVSSLLMACMGTPTASPPVPPLTSSSPLATVEPSFTAAPSPTPTTLYSHLPVISPANASSVREIKRLSKGTVQHAVWTPDSTRLVVGTANGIYVYDVTTHEELQYFNSDAPADCMTISPDGQWLAWCDGPLPRIWNLATAHEQYSMKGGDNGVKAIVFGPDRQTVAIERIIQRSDGEGTPEIDATEVLDLSDGHLLFTIEPGSDPVFSPDGHLLTVAVDEQVQVWNMATRRFEYAVDTTWSLLFSPDGRFLALYRYEETHDHRVELRDLATRRLLCEFKVDSWPDLAFNPDGTRLVISSTAGSAEIWDTSTCHLRDTISGHQGYVQVAYSPEGQTLATLGLVDNIMKLWNSVTGEQIRTLGGFYGDWQGFSPDGKMILEKRWYDGSAAVWSVSDGMPIWVLKEHMLHASSVAFSPDGHLLASGHDGGQVRLWSLESRQITTSFGGFSFVSDVAFSPDGQMIAAGGMINSSHGEDIRIEIKNVNPCSTQPEYSWVGNTTDKTWITRIAFSADGKFFAAASQWDYAIRLWDVSTRQIRMVFVLPNHLGEPNLAFAPDSQAIAMTDGNGRIGLWDYANTRWVAGLWAPGITDRSKIIATSSDRRILAAADDKTVWLWDLRTRDLIATLEDVKENILSLAVSRDGAIVALSERNSKESGYHISLWDVKNQQRLAYFRASSGLILRLVFSPDGRLLASAGSDGVVRLWGVR